MAGRSSLIQFYLRFPVSRAPLKRFLKLFKSEPVLISIFDCRDNSGAVLLQRTQGIISPLSTQGIFPPRNTLNTQGDSNPNEHTGEFFTHGEQRGNPQSTKEEGFFPTKHTGRFLPLRVHRLYFFHTSTPEHTKELFSTAHK